MSDDNKKLHQAILSTIRSRSKWETRQSTNYEMRHNGIRRQNKPFPNASDLHFPLIDTNIDKLKPLFFQQIVGMDVVATFVPMVSQMAGATTMAEQWFDYKVREKSNLQDEGLSWIDYALMGGRAVLKVMWDLKNKRLKYEAVDPMYFITATGTKNLQEADWLVHVMPMSKEAYVRAGIYKDDEQTLARISGKGQETTGSQQNDTALIQQRQIREGITHNADANTIIVWEVYKQTDEGKWKISTYSPVAIDISLRDDMELLYDHGEAPFVDFPYEIKDKGWYSPRGIAEMLKPYEIALTNTWNHKHDSMAYFNKPLFKAERDVPNTLNLRMQPGQILPYGVAPVTMPQPPMSFDEDMVQMRGIAEQRVANPDYGIGQMIDTKNRRSATEVSAITAQAGQAGDLRARIFRMALGKVYKQSWALLIQFDKEDLNFVYLDASMAVDADVLHVKYHIAPKGGLNEVNKQALMQRAVQRKAIFQNSPWINQAELDRSILELDDPTLIKRVFTDPQQKNQDEQTDEAKDIPALLIGYPVPVKKGDNYALRVGVLMQFLQQAIQIKLPLLPIGIKAIVGRLDALLQADATVDANGSKQLRKQVGEFLSRSGILAQMQAASPVIPGQQPQPAQGPAPQQQ